MLDTRLFTHRRSRPRVHLLDENDNYLRELSTVELDGRVELNAFRSVQGGGALSIYDDGQDINFASDRVRLEWVVEGVQTWGLGTFLLDESTLHYSPNGKSWSVSLLDKNTVLAQEQLPATSVGVHTGVVMQVESFILDAGETAINSQRPDYVDWLTRQLVWEAGTTRLQIINDLLASVGYWSLWTDARGIYQVQPYVRPQDRPVAVELVEGSRSVHSATWDYSQDTHAVPNRVIATSQAEGEEEPMQEVVDLPADSPYSAASRGRVLTEFLDNVQVIDRAALQVAAWQALVAGVSPVATLTIEHIPLPIRPNEVVRFTSQGYSALCTIHSTDMSLRASGLMTTKLREVVRL